VAVKYIKSFDGLRGVGALMILLYHWPSHRFSISHGWEFMQMFFVMSGYLITMVLLEEKNKYTFKKFAGRFYLKRSLRLFPLYFAYILAALFIYFITSATGITKEPFASDVYKHGIYLFTYTYNLMNIINFWLGFDYTSEYWSTHLWTLSMEEQFYLVFPFIVFYLSHKNLKRFAIFCIIGAFLFRIASFQWYMKVNPDDYIWVVQNLVRIPFAQMDSFAFGACIAIFPLTFIKSARNWFYVITAIIVLAYSTNMAYVYWVQGENYYDLTFGKKMAEAWMAHNYFFAYIITLVNLWCAILLLYLIRSKNGNPFFEWKPLMFLGKLSYGFYILHVPILFLYFKILKKIIPLSWMTDHWWIELLLLFVYIAITTFISYYVNQYFEAYFIRLKNKYIKKEAETLPSQA
jgi:peptidoglycan/LPS O-acetylase OafA/YrhL